MLPLINKNLKQFFSAFTVQVIYSFLFVLYCFIKDRGTSQLCTVTILTVFNNNPEQLFVLLKQMRFKYNHCGSTFTAQINQFYTLHYSRYYLK